MNNCTSPLGLSGMERIRLKLPSSRGIFLLVVLACIQVASVRSAVDIKITLKTYSHTEAERASTRCCQNINSYACTTLQKLCDYIFEICLDSDPSPSCTTSIKQTYSARNTANSFTFDAFARLQLTLADKWTGSATLKVAIYDGAVDEASRVDTITYTLNTLNSATTLTEKGSRTSPTTLSLEYLANVDCDAPRNCDDGFFVCDNVTGAATCDPAYVNDGICKTQISPPSCNLPTNPAPAVALQGYFRGTDSCGGDIPAEMFFFKAQGAPEGYIQYTKGGELFRQGVQVTSTDATTYSVIETSQYLLGTGTPLSLNGTATVTTDLSKFTFVFGSCTVNFQAEATTSTNLCHGQGQCTKEAGVEYCCCNTGFTGVFCEQQQDICSPNPCQGGNCTVNGTDFTCDCPTGYYGKTCELYGAAVTCTSQVCPGTTCQQANSPSFSCECPADVTATCPDVKITPCPNNMYGAGCSQECIPRDDCGGHYTCDVTTGNKICYTGYKGNNCTERDFTGTGTDPACPASGPCQNGGHCWNGTCCCPEDFTGANCEISLLTTTESPTTGGSTVTEANTTQAPTTEAMTTQAPTTEATTNATEMTTECTTEVSTTEQQTTQAMTMEVTTTKQPTTTDVMTTKVTTTEQPTTEAMTTEVTTTEQPTTTGAIATEVTTTEQPTTTGAITTELTTAEQPTTTDAMTTEVTTTAQPTTDAITTKVTTTGQPTTDAMTTEVATTEEPTTAYAMTTKVTTTEQPTTTEATTTEATATEQPSTTDTMTTKVTTTEQPTTTEGMTTKVTTTEQPTTTEGMTTKVTTTEQTTTTECCNTTTDATTASAETTVAATTAAATTAAATTAAATTAAATTAAATTAAATTAAATEAATTAATVEATTTAASSSNIVTLDQVTLEKLKALLLQLLSGSATAAPQVAANQVGGPQAQAQSAASSQVRAVSQAGETAEQSAPASTSPQGYLPCPTTSVASDDTTNTLTFTLDCTNLGLGTNITASVKLVYTVLNGQVVSEFQFSSDNAVVEQLISDAVTKAFNDNDLSVVDRDAIKKEQFPYEKRYEFIAKGMLLDDTWADGAELVFAAAFSNLYPDIANITVYIERITEAIGEQNIEITVFSYWVGQDNDPTQLLDPATYAAPTAETLASNLTHANRSVEPYNGEVYDYEDSFGLFIEGKVVDEDFEKFEQVLTEWWQKESGDTNYEDVTIYIKETEKYFTSSMGGWTECTKLVYFVKLSDGTFVSGNWFDVTVPTVAQITAKINFTSAMGTTYTVLKSTSRRLNTTQSESASSSEFFRAKEAFRLYVTGRYSEDLMFVSTVESRLATTFDFVSNASYAIVLGSEEVINTMGDSFSCIYIAIINNGTGEDARRMQGIFPSNEELTETIGTLVRPNGEPYTFVTNKKMLVRAVAVSSCFTQTISGSVTKQEFSKFETSIKVALLETNDDLTDSSTRVRVVTGREMISPNGTTLTTILYTVTLTSGGLIREVDASVSLENRISVKTLSSKIDFTRPDGAPFEVFSGDATALIQYDDTMALFVDSTVVKTDYEKFEEKLTTIIREKVTATVTKEVTVKVVKQEKTVSQSGEFVFKLSYSVMAGDEVVIPQAIPVIEPSRLQTEVQVTNPAGQSYGLMVESSETSTLIREETLFYSVLTTQVAESDKDSLEAALVAAWKAQRTRLSTATVECKILFITEYVSITSVSSYKVSYSITVNSRMWSALEEQSVSIKKVTEQITQITNPQGKAYEVAENVKLSTLTDMSISTSVVLATAFSETETGSMTEAILAASSTSLSAEIKESLSITVVRQREVLVQKTGSFSYAVDYQLVIDGQVASASVLPMMERTTLVSTFKALTDVEIEVLDVELTEVFSELSTYSLILNVDVQESIFTSFQTIIEESFSELRESNSSTVEVTIATTEETFDIETGESFFSLRYTVEVDGKYLDAQIDTLPSTETLTTNIEENKLVNVNGENFTVINVTSSPQVVRKSQCASVTVEGSFSESDTKALSESVQSVVNTNTNDAKRRRKRATTSSASAIISTTAILDVKSIKIVERFNADGSIFTEVLMQIKAGDLQVNPAILAPISMERVMVELNQKTLVKVGGYTVVEKTVLKSLVDVSSSFSFFLDVAVVNSDITTLEAKILSTLKTRTEFSSMTDLKVTVARQAEMLSTTGVTTRQVYFFVKSGSKVISSRVVRKLSTTELTTSLSFSISSRTSVSYSSVISVSQSAKLLIARSKLHSVTIDRKMLASSFSTFESSMTTVVSSASGLQTPKLKVITQEEYVDIKGAISYRVLFSVRSGSKMFRSVDIKAAKWTAISSALSTASIRTAKGVLIKAVETTVASAQVRAANLFSFSMTTSIQRLDLVSVEARIATAFAETHTSVDISTVSVTILRQFEVVNELSQSYTRIQYSVKVSGKLQSALTMVKISTEKITSALSSVVIMGTSKTYSSAVVDISSIRTIEARALATTIISTAVKGAAAKADLEAAMTASLIATNPALADPNIRVVMVSEEEVMTATGEIKIKVGFSIRTSSSVTIDYREVANFDLTTLDVQVAASSILVSAGISVEKTITMESVRRLALATTVFLKVAITREDREKILIELTDAYHRSHVSLSSVSLKFAANREYIGTNGELVTGFSFFVETAEGKVIKQSLSLQTLEATLSLITTSRQERITIAEVTNTKSFVLKRSAFSLVLKEKIKEVDFVSVHTALEQAWVDKNKGYLKVLPEGSSGTWKVTIIGQVEGVAADGSSMVQVLYTLAADSTIVNAYATESVSITSVKQYLESVTISGTNKKYNTIVGSNAQAASFVANSKLCVVVMNQLVPPALFNDFSAALVTAWKSVTQFNTLTISVRTQEEMIFRGQTVYGVHYEAQSPEDATICPDFQPDFLAAFRTSLSLTTVTGVKLTVSSARSSQLVLKSTAFSFTLTESIKQSDFTKVEVALASAWQLAFGVEANVRLTVQDEMITLTGQTVFSVRFLVEVNEVFVDASVTAGLTVAQITAALSTINVGASSTFYSSLLVSVTANSVFAYQSSFYLHITTMASQTSLPDFKIALRTSWQQSVTEFASKTVDIKILTQEEVVDSLGTFAIRMVYAMSVDSVQQDSRLITRLTDVAIDANLQRKIQYPGGSYVILTSLRPPIHRLSQGVQLYVDANVPNADNVKFEEALTAVYRTRIAGTISIKIVHSEQYIKMGRFVTALVYFVSVDGLLAIPSSLPELTVAMRAQIQVSSGANVNYKLISDLTGLFRYRDHFSVHISRPILTSQLDVILNGLLSEWKLAEAAIANDLTIVMGVQEEAASEQGATVWRLVYFLKNEDAVIPSATFSRLSSASILNVLDVSISGSTTLKYSSFFIDDSVKVIRLSDLLSVAINSRVATSKLAAFESGLTAAWIAFDASFSSIDIKIMSQDLYISRQGEKVFQLFYMATLGDKMLSGMDFSLPLGFLNTFLKVESPQGVPYTLYVDSLAGLRRYKSAFSVYLTKPVLSGDMESVLEGLKSAWKIARPELTDVSLKNAVQEEFLYVESESVYKFSYFVSAEGAAVDALFDTSLTTAQLTAALSITISGQIVSYSDVLFTKEVSELIAISELVTVPFTTRVAAADYAQISAVIQTAWRALGAQWDDVIVRVRAQEEFLTPSGRFVFGLMYSITKTGKVLTLEDLPDLPMDALSGVSSIVGPAGQYRLAEVAVGELHRYQVAMHVYLDRWVAVSDQKKVAVVIQNMIKAVQPEYFSLRIEVAAQIWQVDTQLDPLVAQKNKLVKLVFFGYLGTRLLDARMETVLDKNALNSQFTVAQLPYQVVSTTTLSTVRALRLSNMVFIEGRIASADVPAFQGSLTAIWRTFVAGASVEIAIAKEEFIGDRQQVLTGISYYVLADGDVVLPQSVAAPTNADMVKSLVVTSQTGSTYKVFTGGNSFNFYSRQYSVSLQGVYDTDGVQPIIAVMKSVWQDLEETDEINIKLTKVEVNLGEFGSRHTKVLYTVVVDGKRSFPDDRPPPDTSMVRRAMDAANLDKVVLYTGDISIRMDNTYSLVIEGYATKEMALQVMGAVRTVWSRGPAATLTAASYSVVGQTSLLSLSKSEPLTRIYYQLKSSGEAVAVEELLPPSIDELETELRTSADLEVYRSAALTVRDLYVAGQLDDSQRPTLETAVQATWAASNVGASVKAIVSSTQGYISTEWLDVTRVGVAIKFDGQEPGINAIIPSDEDVNDGLSRSRMELCGCKAKRKYKVFLSGSTTEIKPKMEYISRGIQNAWARVNLDIEDRKISVEVKPLVPRRHRRDGHLADTEFVGPDGQFVTPVVFSVAVGGQDPVPVFVAPPDENILNDELLKAAGVRSCGCTPRRCNIIRLLGETKKSDEANIIKALKESYVKANPDVKESEIDVEISDVNNDKRDPASGMVVSEVRYCVSSSLVDPSEKDLRDALKKYGKNLFEGDVTDLNKPNNDWIMIVSIACGAVALVLVALATITVCYRHRRRYQDKTREQRAQSTTGGGYSSAYGLHLDEETYAGHGTYHTAFASKPDSNDPSFYGKGHMYDPRRSYMISSGNMLIK